MTIGIRRGTVALAPHEAEWEQEAARTVALLKEILGGAAEDIQHVGSTSIPLIKAKPIVDIAVAATDFQKILNKRDPLEAAGFYYRPNNNLRGQLLFARGSCYNGTGELQTHFIHVVPKDGEEWRGYIRFRDYMNAFPAAAKRYEALKERLAQEAPVDAGREHYTAGKHGFIQNILRRATVWSLLGKNAHIVIDRPMGYVHKKDGYTLTYPVNYGYIPGITGGDGEDIDVYLLGADGPVKEADCRVIGAACRKNDCEDKLIASLDGRTYTKEEMEAAVRFQEQWYDTAVISASDAASFDALYEQ